MAQIRIVTDWLRSPVSAPSHFRSMMIVAERWGEQRVLMRAYASSRDRALPTIVLHGIELAIGPAGTDPNGAWGIHVGDRAELSPPHVQAALEEAARRLAGAEAEGGAQADQERAHGREPRSKRPSVAPRMFPQRIDARAPGLDVVTQAAAARIPQAQAAAIVPRAFSPVHVQQSAVQVRDVGIAPPSNAELRKTPVPRQRTGKTRPPPVSARTALGYASGAGAQSVLVRLGLSPGVSASLGRYADRVVPADFTIGPTERKALDALGGADQLTARQLGQVIHVTDAVAFMEDLTRKLEQCGLGDLVQPGAPSGGEPTYRLNR